MPYLPYSPYSSISRTPSQLCLLFLLESRDTYDLGNAAQAAEHMREMQAVLHLDREHHRRVCGAGARLGLDVVDVGVGFGDFGGQPREDAAVVLRGHAHVHVEEPVGRRIPLHIDPLLGIEVEGMDRGT